MASKAPELSLEQWLVELNAIQKPDTDGWLSTKDIATILGHGVGWVQRNILHPASTQGRLEVKRVHGTGVAGQGCTLTFYRIKGVTCGKKAKG